LSRRRVQNSVVEKAIAECLAGWGIFPEEGDERQQNGILDAIMGYDPHDGDLSASDDWQAKSERWTANPMDPHHVPNPCH
jgi:hypothetical protein